MRIESSDAQKNGIIAVANLMCIAARTAPKARGIDNIVTTILTGKEIEELSAKMVEIANTGYRTNTFLRDAECVKKAAAIILIGTKISAIGLDCGFCGFESCKKCEQMKGVCVYNSGDLGIAVGSAVSIAADNRVDNRIMYTAGFAAVKNKLLGEDVKIAYGIPLSATGKNIFFERK
ncbi:MAG: ferredoxin [Elusimicrobia bacterium CG06_land_8_20_14_3_00_38_11]|nr:MAG: ferredoxin [Elusimicrobia bacterium CG06_land_8_20_14_3_00_38_11]